MCLFKILKFHSVVFGPSFFFFYGGQYVCQIFRCVVYSLVLSYVKLPEVLLVSLPIFPRTWDVSKPSGRDSDNFVNKIFILFGKSLK